MIFTVKDYQGKVVRSLGVVFFKGTNTGAPGASAVCDEECNSLSRSTHDTVNINSPSTGTTTYQLGAGGIENMPDFCKDGSSTKCSYDTSNPALVLNGLGVNIDFTEGTCTSMYCFNRNTGVFTTIDPTH